MNDDIVRQLQQATSEAQKTWIITDALLKTLPNTLAEGALAAAVPHWFNADILAALLQVESAEAEHLYHDLQVLSISEPFGVLGYALHDLTRTGILSHLAANQTDLFINYSQGAYQYFCQFEDQQNTVEALYHLLATNKLLGLEKFKKQMNIYRRETNFSAANNLVRNALELVKLELLSDTEETEIERQNYLMGWEFARLGRSEAMPEKACDYLTQAIKIFNPAEDINNYKELEPSQLHDTVNTIGRSFLMQKLDEAKQLGDINRQIVWLTELGRISSESKDYETALQHYTDALALDENNTYAITGRGATYGQMGNYPAALADFDRTIELNDKYAWAIACRGKTHRLMDNYSSALADFNQAIELNDKYGWAITQRGEAYRLMGNYPAALADFNRSIELGDKDSWAIAHRGETYRQMGNYPAALADFDRAIELNDKYTWAITSRGETYQQMGNYPAALADFDRAIELNDKYTWAITSRGETYRQMGDYPAALADFNRAIQLDNKYVWAITSRGKTYRQMGNYQAALADFDRAIELDNKYAWAITNRGETYRLMGNYPASLADFDRAIELDNKYGWAITNRGETYRLMGNYPASLADFDRAITLAESTTKDLFNSRGLVLSSLGRYAEAIDSYKQELRENPNSFIYLYNIAVAIMRWKGLPEAQTSIDKSYAALQAVINTDNHYSALYGLGGLAALKGDTVQALTYLQEAVSLSAQVIDWARHDVAWLDLRSDPRFQSIISMATEARKI